MSKILNFFNSNKYFLNKSENSDLSHGFFSASGYLQPWKKTAWVFNVAKWKRPLLKKYFPNHRMHFMALKESLYKQHSVISLSINPVFIVWGMNQPDDLAEYAAEYNIPIVRVEDGFIRSIGLGADHNLPYSLCIDESGIYFDSSCESDLEKILLNYDFKKDEKLMKQAIFCLDEIRRHGLSKYNQILPEKAALIYGPKVKRRILVIGQVEDDQSLLFGCSQIRTNVELIRLAARENPGAQIIYKTHPDIIAGKRNEISNPSDVENLAEILTSSLSLKDALHEVDRVYTLTSLAGFEALIHGVAVTTVGAPFYSGWGLTDDRQFVDRRNRKLSLEELFAAAYILYPKYYDPVDNVSTTLIKVIEVFKQQFEEIKFITPVVALERFKAFNLATQTAVNSRFIYNSTTQSVVIVSDTPESLELAKGLAAKGKNVTILCTRDSIANDDVMLLSTEESKRITVSSIHKRYSVALSETEAHSVELVKNFSSSLFYVLNSIAAKHIPTPALEALAMGLEDFAYFEALRFLAAKSCLQEFETIVLLIENYESNIDVVQSFAYHAENSGSLGRVYLKTLSEDTKSVIKELFSSQRKVLKNHLDEAQLKTDFSSFWYDLQNENFDEYNELKNHIVVCGNVAKGNYAYMPASIKLIEVLTKKSNKPLVFYSSGLLNADGQEEVKTVTLNEKFSQRCTVYAGCAAKFQIKYPESILVYKPILTEAFNAFFMETVGKRLPYKLINIFIPRLEKYVQGLFLNIIFIAESIRLIERCSLFATAMDRSMISRVLTAIAHSKSVPTIGIQPQIISASPRYIKPAVQHMGVIDTAQSHVYEMLGAKKNTLVPIGSINIISRLEQIIQAEKEIGMPANSRRILFAMQHSTKKEMLEISIALRDISLKLGMELIVKPHPHQELPVLHEVRRIFSDIENVEVLTRGSDTYAAAARCGIVVGLFSSVLLETALSGKSVVIAAFGGIDESIDFSLRGIALKAFSAEELEAQLMDILNNGPLSKNLNLSRNEYIKQNPQFAKPYTHKHIDHFIESALV